METKILIDFQDTDPAEANRLALDLKNYLLRNAEVETDIIKKSTDTMDFGATLVILLGTSSIVALAKGIANWLEKHHSKKLTFKTANEEIIGENLSSADIKDILEKIKQ
jgi:hypothetical protein